MAEARFKINVTNLEVAARNLLSNCLRLLVSIAQAYTQHQQRRAQHCISKSDYFLMNVEWSSSLSYSTGLAVVGVVKWNV